MRKIKLYLLSLGMIISISGCSASSQVAETNVATETTTEAATVKETTKEVIEDTTADETTTVEETTTIEDTTTAEETTEAPAYPVTLTDQAGREVTISEKPEKIVSGYYIPSSLLIALGLEDKMVGIEAKANKRNIYKLAAPELIDLPNVGTAKEFDLEGCAALNPDLVILPMKAKAAAETLTELGINVLVVNPESDELLTETIALISTATDTTEKADELLTYINSQKDKLKKALADVDAKTVYLAGNSSTLSTAGAAMYQSSLIELAGGKNVAGEIEDTYWAEISYEQLLAWDPEYIIIASDASYPVEEILSDANLADCTAVKNGNVYAIPGEIEALDSPVPASILASNWLAGILHPELVSADDYTTERNSYYENFYGFSYQEQ